jgi:HEAT repeat protein
MAETRNRGRKIIQEFRVQLEEAARAKYGKKKSHWYISIGEKLHLTPRRVGGFFRGESSDHATAIVEHLGLNPQKVLEYPGSLVLTSISVDIDWRQKCLDRLENQKSLTLNPLLNGRDFRIDDIHVPLGLIQEKKKSQSENSENSEKDTEIELFTHYRFLSDAIGGQKRRLAIVGEPGAGKTTLMVKIGEYIRDIGLGVPLWISLGLLAGRSITDYLRDEWIRGDLDLPEPLPIKNELTSLIQFLKSNEIWLLLDGVDEMSATNTLDRLRSDLSKGWAESARSIVSCRLNVWYVDRQALGVGADVYQMQNFEIAADPAQDMTFQFTQRFFSRVEADKLASDGDLTVEQQQASEIIGQKQALLLRQDLLAPGKENVRESVRNPLRLGLLCNIWDARQSLPETKAILYGRFVEWFYQWKDNLVHLSLAQRQDLNTRLGELARQGIDRAQLYFTEAEALVVLGNEGWKLAKEVGLLNSLVRRGDEYIYGFYHATFQEYFAACSVSDWDFWLPRDHVDFPVPCWAEQQPTYRLFEKRWQEVILLWMGRDIDSELKEEFLKRLTNFQERTEKFYYYRAYCLAAICIGEFKLSRQAWSIVQQIVKWVCGYFDNEKQTLVKCSHIITSLAQEVLPLTHREYSISTLLFLFPQSTLDGHGRYLVANALQEIAVRDDKTISVLLSILLDSDSSHDLRNSVLKVLGKVGVRDDKTISVLRSILSLSDLDYSWQYYVAAALGRVDEGNVDAISVLLSMLPQQDSNLQYLESTTFREIAIGDDKAITALVNILSQSDSSDDLKWHILNILREIATGDDKSITALVNILSQSDSSDRLKWMVIVHLGYIAIGDEKAISVLTSLLLEPNLSYTLLSSIPECLVEIAIGNDKAISALISLLSQPGVHNNLKHYDYAISALGEIGMGSIKAHSILLSFLSQPNLDEGIYWGLLTALGKVDVGDSKEVAISSLLHFISQPDIYDDTKSLMISTLGEIAIGDVKTITALLPLLYEQDLWEDVRFNAAQALGQIAVGNVKVIAALLPFLSQPDLDVNLRSSVTLALSEAMTIEMMPMVINQLKNQVATEIESDFEVSGECYYIISQCVQSLSYQEFDTAWYSSLNN